jgi:hypothetical protein
VSTGNRPERVVRFRVAWEPIRPRSPTVCVHCGGRRAAGAPMYRPVSAGGAIHKGDRLCRRCALDAPD